MAAHPTRHDSPPVYEHNGETLCHRCDAPRTADDVCDDCTIVRFDPSRAQLQIARVKAHFAAIDALAMRIAA